MIIVDTDQRLIIFTLKIVACYKCARSGVACILVLDVMAGCVNCVGDYGHGCSLAPRYTGGQVRQPYGVIVAKRFHAWQIYRFMHRLGNWLIPSDMTNIDFRPLIPLKSPGLGFSSLSNIELKDERNRMKKRWPRYKTSKQWLTQYYGVPYEEAKEAWKDWKPTDIGDFYETHPAVVWDCLTPFPDDMEDTIDNYYALVDSAAANKDWNAEMVTSGCYPEAGKGYDDYVGWRPYLNFDEDDEEYPGSVDEGSQQDPQLVVHGKQAGEGLLQLIIEVKRSKIFAATTSSDDALGEMDVDMVEGDDLHGL